MPVLVCWCVLVRSALLSTALTRLLCPWVLVGCIGCGRCPRSRTAAITVRLHKRWRASHCRDSTKCGSSGRTRWAPRPTATAPGRCPASHPWPHRASVVCHPATQALARAKPSQVVGVPLRLLPTDAALVGRAACLEAPVTVATGGGRLRAWARRVAVPCAARASLHPWSHRHPASHWHTARAQGQALLVSCRVAVVRGGVRSAGGH